MKWDLDSIQSTGRYGRLLQRLTVNEAGVLQVLVSNEETLPSNLPEQITVDSSLTVDTKALNDEYRISLNALQLIFKKARSAYHWGEHFNWAAYQADTAVALKRFLKIRWTHIQTTQADDDHFKKSPINELCQEIAEAIAHDEGVPVEAILKPAVISQPVLCRDNGVYENYLKQDPTHTHTQQGWEFYQKLMSTESVESLLSEFDALSILAKNYLNILLNYSSLTPEENIQLETLLNKFPKDLEAQVTAITKKWNDFTKNLETGRDVSASVDAALQDPDLKPLMSYKMPNDLTPLAYVMQQKNYATALNLIEAGVTLFVDKIPERRLMKLTVRERGSEIAAQNSLDKTNLAVALIKKGIFPSQDYLSYGIHAIEQGQLTPHNEQIALACCARMATHFATFSAAQHNDFFNAIFYRAFQQVPFERYERFLQEYRGLSSFLLALLAVLVPKAKYTEEFDFKPQESEFNFSVVAAAMSNGLMKQLLLSGDINPGSTNNDLAKKVLKLNTQMKAHASNPFALSYEDFIGAKKLHHIVELLGFETVCQLADKAPNSVEGRALLLQSQICRVESKIQSIQKLEMPFFENTQCLEALLPLKEKMTAASRLLASKSINDPIMPITDFMQAQGLQDIVQTLGFATVCTLTGIDAKGIEAKKLFLQSQVCRIKASHDAGTDESQHKINAFQNLIANPPTEATFTRAFNDAVALHRDGFTLRPKSTTHRQAIALGLN